MTTLQTIPVNEPYQIVRVSGDGATAQRLRELGFLPGAICTVVRRAPFGGPMEVALERRNVGLRLTSDVQIQVEPLTLDVDLFRIGDSVGTSTDVNSPVAA